MCGVCGVLGGSRKAVEAMSDALAHRGPDADGIWSSDEVVLGHRRLAIIDTSHGPDQPFINKQEDLIIVFNGEIYNYKELRAQLSNYHFRTRSDTEVLLAAYQEWGCAMLDKLNGMFVFAIWNVREQELFIARDRLGIKPLYYSNGDDHFVFASEIRAILASGLVERNLDHDALVDHLRYQSVQAPHTLVRNVKMLMPGNYMVISDGYIEEKTWWQMNDPPVIRFGSENDLKEQIRDLFMKSVERRMIADVPYGAFLSGGIDSSLVVAAMTEVSGLPVKTFNVSFDEAEFSEAKFARTISKKFSTEHTEILLKPQDMLDLLPDALGAMDHPSGDGPNTYVVSKATREAGITMALSGLGGDELFAGYDIFKRTLELEGKKWIPSFPKILRRAGARALLGYKRSMSSLKIGELIKQDAFHLEDTYPISRLTFMDHELVALLTQSKLPPDRVRAMVLEKIGPETLGAFLPLLSKVSVAEMSSYMQNTLLRDTDQMSMAHALEVRVPFLDHELVSFMLQVSDKDKYPSTPKRLLVDSMDGLLPREIWDRPKMGFTLPWANWMRNDLRIFCREHMHALSDRAMFNGIEVRSYWQRFLKKDPIMPWSRIWHLVVLEHWLQAHDIKE